MDLQGGDGAKAAAGDWGLQVSYKGQNLRLVYLDIVTAAEKIRSELFLCANKCGSEIARHT
jgi:hypothetical protein